MGFYLEWFQPACRGVFRREIVAQHCARSSGARDGAPPGPFAAEFSAQRSPLSFSWWSYAGE
jgi:hypothetical protein